MDPWHEPGPSKYGSAPWTPFHGPPIFTPPKIAEVSNNKIKHEKKSKLKNKK